MGHFFARLMKRAGKVGGGVEKYQEAVTFAEAGEQEHAKTLFHADADVAQKNAGKLLVVGREGTFSREVIDYALEMAQRLSYEILALNTAALSGETFRLFSSSRRKLSEDFRALSEKNARTFQQEAEGIGIPFAHVVKFSDKDEAIDEVSREFEHVEFVVSDTEEERLVDRPGEGERASQAIYVYSVT